MALELRYQEIQKRFEELSGFSVESVTSSRNLFHLEADRVVPRKFEVWTSLVGLPLPNHLAQNFQALFHNKDHVCLVAESMASLKVKILTSIVDSMMKSSYFKLCFFPVFRPLLLPRCSTLQHFKPTLPVSEKSCWFDSEIIASYQKRFQSNINPDSSPKRYRLRNISITHDRDNCIPNSSSCSRYNPDSFCPKPFWD